MLTFWQMIEMLCEQKGVSPKVMAMRLHIKQCTLRDWKYKGTIPRWATLVKLSEYFHVPMDYFLEYKKNQFRKK